MTETEFNTCVMRYHQEMTACAVRILRDTDDVRDCIQESYARLWRGRSRLREIENVRGYCLATVRNCALASLKEKMQYSDLEDVMPTDPDRPDLRREREEEVEVIAIMIRQLPAREREVLTMSTLGGMEHEEVCKATGLTDQNVRTILSRARKRLREMWSGRDKPSGTGKEQQIVKIRPDKIEIIQKDRTERRKYGGG